MSVVDFAKAKEERTPHCRGTAFCMTCDHEWEGVWPAGTVGLECPSCGACVGRSKYEVSPPEGTHVWQCNTCSNQLFNLLPDRVHCPGCGQQWDYGQLAL
jgi:DNA-directed RNA polymerase subunit RPC12/RpoP